MFKIVFQSVIHRNARRYFSSCPSIFTPQSLECAGFKCNYRSLFVTKVVEQTSVVEQKAPSSVYGLNQTFMLLKILRLIKGAVKEFGPILERNTKLASTLKKADELNVPIDFIDFARKISVDSRAKIGIYELLYLNNGFFVVQYEDIDTSNTKHHLLKICNEYDIYLIQGRVRWDEHFNIKGIVSVQDTKLNSLSSEKNAEKMALKIGAQSVRKEIELGNWSCWQFYCEPEELFKVKQKLQEYFEIDEAYVGFVPKRKVYLPAHVKRSTHSIISQISDNPAIHHIYTNIVI